VNYIIFIEQIKIIYAYYMADYDVFKRQIDDMINNHFIDIKTKVYDKYTNSIGNNLYSQLSNPDIINAICDNMKNIPLYLRNKKDYIRLVNQFMSIYRLQHRDEPDMNYGFVLSIYRILDTVPINRCLEAKQQEDAMLTLQFLNSGRAGPNVVNGVSSDVAKVMGSYVNQNVLPDIPIKRSQGYLERSKPRRGGKYSKRHKKTKTKRNKKHKTKKNRK